MYRNANIFSNEGITKFAEDARLADDYFMREAYGVDLADARSEIEEG
jgi:hypothetical protein